MNKFKYITGLLAVCLFAMACSKEDFLDKYPLDEVAEDFFFEKPNDAKLYVNQFYERGVFNIRTIAGGDRNSDLYISQTGVDSRLEGNRTVNSAPALNYTKIRSVNYFFENYHNIEGEFDEYKQYVGEAHFFKAFFYYDLLRSFGDVQWLDKVLTTESPELYEGRNPRNEVADKIIAHLDTAAMYLTESKIDDGTRVNKWIALLIQSRVALYEGSWEKYHAGTAFGVSNPNPQKYFNKAIEAAEQIMNSGLYDIYTTGNPDNDYYELFGLRDYATNPEVLFWIKMDLSQGIHSTSKLYRLETPAGYSLTKDLADSYLCTDGQPITVSNLFQGYANINKEMENRDPRFEQTIFNTSHDWQIDAEGNVKKWQEVYNKLYSNTTHAAPAGYVRRKDYNPIMAYHHLNFEETPTPLYRYSEVLLNYIEAKAELGEATQADVDKTIKKLRDRVGMPNLVISNITADPNWNFPDLSPLINEIRRERKVEMALEDLRWDDIARWAAADELIVGKRPKGAKKDQFPITPSFPADENGFLDPFQAALPNGYRFDVNRDYLNPLPLNQLTLNPSLEQNPGWK
ncbi:RagB/SusD family nutrient uptake outer membrane protein [Albibacterium indicum]|uniref:RagB/SusD family nutrient uptake outer membrane protein n=1 Tax=Albibacterium indicum TaxID=2292082 RepID=UPI000E48FD21|nr:RagB/SusD family nutrient uptake outer membrane protein [Pedobacter indicus]